MVSHIYNIIGQKVRTTLELNLDTYNEAKLFVIPGIHGFAFLNIATAVVGFQFCIKSDSSEFKYDIPLSLAGFLKKTHCKQRIGVIPNTITATLCPYLILLFSAVKSQLTFR